MLDKYIVMRKLSRSMKLRTINSHMQARRQFLRIYLA